MMKPDEFKRYLSTIKGMRGKYFVIIKYFEDGRESPNIYNSDNDLIQASIQCGNVCNILRIIGVIRVSDHNDNFYEYPYPMEIPIGFMFSDETVFTG